jgi:hypothetical protein
MGIWEGRSGIWVYGYMGIWAYSRLEGWYTLHNQVGFYKLCMVVYGHTWKPEASATSATVVQIKKS